MPAWAIPVLLAFALPLQAEEAPTPSASEAEIREAVLQLGAAKFAVRRQATTFLWQQGRAAEAALEQAAQSVDREVRLRAETILSDFSYGILPGVPPDVVGLLRKYR